MFTGIARGVVRVAALKWEIEHERIVCVMLNAVVVRFGNGFHGHKEKGDEVQEARYPIAEDGGEEPLPVHPAVRRSGEEFLAPRNVFIRAGVGIECVGRRHARSTAKNLSCGKRRRRRSLLFFSHFSSSFSFFHTFRSIAAHQIIASDLNTFTNIVLIKHAN